MNDYAIPLLINICQGTKEAIIIICKNAHEAESGLLQCLFEHQSHNSLL